MQDSIVRLKSGVRNRGAGSRSNLLSADHIDLSIFSFTGEVAERQGHTKWSCPELVEGSCRPLPTKIVLKRHGFTSFCSTDFYGFLECNSCSLKTYPIVTNMKGWTNKVVKFYIGRGTAEQWIKEGKNAVNWTRLSCSNFRDKQVRLQLFVLAYNPGNFLRNLALPRRIRHWSLTTLREKLIKIGAKIVKGS